jgi:hypothetical protein
MKEKIINYITTDLSLEKFCLKYNYHILHLNYRNKQKISEIMLDLHLKNQGDCLFVAKDFEAIIEKWLDVNGTPDFFMYSDEEWLLCEFKSKNDNLRKEQIEFIRNNADIKIIVLHSIFEDTEPKLLQIISKSYDKSHENYEGIKSKSELNTSFIQNDY